MSFRAVARRAAFLLALAIVFGAAPAAPETSLERLQREMEASRREKEAAERAYQEALEELRRIQGARQSAVARLVRARARLRLAESRVRRARANLAEVEANLKLLARRIADLEGTLRDLRDRLAAQARALFALGERARVEFLLSSRDATDLALRARLLAAVSERNAALIDSAVAENLALQAARAEAEAERERRRAILVELESARREVEAERRELQSLVNRLTAEEKRAAKRRDEAEAQIRRAAERIRALAAKIEELRNRLPTPGRFRRPVSGPRFVPDVPVGGGGIYLEVPEGTVVRAAAAGEVISVETFRGFGTTVILGHGGGYSTVYGNLRSASVAVGERVAAGDPVGRSGRSPFGPMLFFSIYRDGRALDAAAALGL
ncbi:MAG: hypothetical protein KatS3mg014_2675 [Actinomycetota bacterium]|nr:MAG: hypothetical protein KatS3mg014_2675 [Actinomycetota bacterium]